jgi:hypothetical protein
LPEVALVEQTLVAVVAQGGIELLLALRVVEPLLNPNFL